MNEMRKTIYFGAAALIMVLAAWITSPSLITPEAFVDQGELFFLFYLLLLVLLRFVLLLLL